MKKTILLLLMALVVPLAMHAQTCEISYSLSDSYGDGWNGNYIIVRDVDANVIIAYWTIPSGYSANGTLSVGSYNGQTLQFEWKFNTNGTYSRECSYTIPCHFVALLSKRDGRRAISQQLFLFHFTW